LTGPRGLASAAEETRRYPIFYVAQVLARMAGKPRLVCYARHPREVACVAVRDERGNLKGVLANLTSQPRTVRVISGKIALFELGPFDCVQFE